MPAEELESDGNGNGNLQAAIEDAVEKTFLASFKQAKVWVVASGQFMVNILVLAAQVLSACLFPSPSSLSLVLL